MATRGGGRKSSGGRGRRKPNFGERMAALRAGGSRGVGRSRPSSAGSRSGGGRRTSGGGGGEGGGSQNARRACTINRCLSLLKRTGRLGNGSAARALPPGNGGSRAPSNGGASRAASERQERAIMAALGPSLSPRYSPGRGPPRLGRLYDPKDPKWLGRPARSQEETIMSMMGPPSLRDRSRAKRRSGFGGRGGGRGRSRAGRGGRGSRDFALDFAFGGRSPSRKSSGAGRGGFGGRDRALKDMRDLLSGGRGSRDGLYGSRYKSRRGRRDDARDAADYRLTRHERRSLNPRQRRSRASEIGWNKRFAQGKAGFYGNRSRHRTTVRDLEDMLARTSTGRTRSRSASRSRGRDNGGRAGSAPRSRRQQLGLQAFQRQQRVARRSQQGAFSQIGGRRHLESLGRREELRQAPWYKRKAAEWARKGYKRVRGWTARDEGMNFGERMAMLRQGSSTGRRRSVSSSRGRDASRRRSSAGGLNFGERMAAMRRSGGDHGGSHGRSRRRSSGRSGFAFDFDY